MKKVFAILLLCALTLAGCSVNENEILFDEATEGIVSVILQDTNDGTLHYDTIGSYGRRQPTQTFESDPVEILTAANDCFENYVEGQSPNRLLRAALVDTNGQPVELTDVESRIFELAAEQEHVIMEMRILRVGEHRFVTLDLNVNLWSPHVVLYYDPDADQLIKLHTYDATSVIGLKILNL